MCRLKSDAFKQAYSSKFDFILFGPRLGIKSFATAATTLEYFNISISFYFDIRTSGKSSSAIAAMNFD